MPASRGCEKKETNKNCGMGTWLIVELTHLSDKSDIFQPPYEGVKNKRQLTDKMWNMEMVGPFNFCFLFST